jgi:hypothetical protein
VDLNTEGDTGLPWASLIDPRDPSIVVEGAWLVVGSGKARADAQVVAQVEGELVWVRPLPGPVSQHRHLLSRSSPRGSPASSKPRRRVSPAWSRRSWAMTSRRRARYSGVVLAPAVSERLVLDAAADLVQHRVRCLDHVEGVRDLDGVGEPRR